MAQSSARRWELPDLEWSCMVHYKIGQGTRKSEYEIQKEDKGGKGWEIE